MKIELKYLYKKMIKWIDEHNELKIDACNVDTFFEDLIGKDETKKLLESIYE